MVFPTGAHVWELAADHLDRLPGKSLLERLVHHRSVAQNDHAARTNEPHDSGDGRGKETDRNGNDIETSVELRGGDARLANLEVLAVELANQEHTRDDKDDVKQQPGVREKGVDAEHHKDDGIVAREVAEVVVDTGLCFGKVGWLRQALDVHKFGDRPEVREAVRKGGRAQALEAVAKVDAGRQGVEGDLNTRHFGCGMMWSGSGEREILNSEEVKRRSFVGEKSEHKKIYLVCD